MVDRCQACDLITKLSDLITASFIQPNIIMYWVLRDLGHKSTSVSDTSLLSYLDNFLSWVAISFEYSTDSCSRYRYPSSRLNFFDTSQWDNQGSLNNIKLISSSSFLTSGLLDLLGENSLVTMYLLYTSNTNLQAFSNVSEGETHAQKRDNSNGYVLAVGRCPRGLSWGHLRARIWISRPIRPSPEYGAGWPSFQVKWNQQYGFGRSTF